MTVDASGILSVPKKILYLSPHPFASSVGLRLLHILRQVVVHSELAC